MKNICIQEYIFAVVGGLSSNPIVENQSFESETKLVYNKCGETKNCTNYSEEFKNIKGCYNILSSKLNCALAFFW